MPCPGPDDKEYNGMKNAHNGSNRILWIGRVCEVKRPDRLIELAKICPDFQFDFVGPTGNSEYARNICKQAKTIPNITYHGSATREQVSNFYKQAKILCCTSDYEGFPNTFLEAWSYGLPVVSTVDPDNLIMEKGLGRVGKKKSALSEGIYSLLNINEQWENASHAAREYYVKNHAVNNAMEKFEQVFYEVGGYGKGDDL